MVPVPKPSMPMHHPTMPKPHIASMHMMTWNVTKNARILLDVMPFRTTTMKSTPFRAAMTVIFMAVDHIKKGPIEQIQNATQCLTVRVLKVNKYLGL